MIRSLYNYKDIKKTYVVFLSYTVNVNIGLIPINPVTEGDNAVVCASLTGEPRSTTFPVTFSTSDGTGPNPALGKSCLHNIHS